MRAAFLNCAAAIATLSACGGPATVNAPVVEAPATAETVTVEPPPPEMVMDLEPTAPSKPSPPSPPPTGPMLAATVESFYVRALPFECDADITHVARATQTSTKSRMHVLFVRPGRFNATFSSGESLTVDAQARTVTRAGGNLQRTPVPADHVPMALAFAGGASALNQHFSMSLNNTHPTKSPTNGFDMLIARPRNAATIALILYVSPSGQVSRSLVVNGATGDRDLFDFQQCRFRIPPPAAFAAPAATSATAASTPALALPAGMVQPLP